jgi:hypothetical protein
MAWPLFHFGSRIRGVPHREPDFLPPANRSISPAAFFGACFLKPTLVFGTHSRERSYLVLVVKASVLRGLAGHDR